MDAEPYPATEPTARSWTVPVVYLVVAVAAVLSTRGHFPIWMAGGGVFAVWCFHTTLLYFERLDAAVERAAEAHACGSSPQVGPHPGS